MRFFKVVFASALGYILAGIVIFGLFMLIIFGLSSGSSKVEIQGDSVLNLKLNYGLEDRAQPNSLAALTDVNPNSNTALGLNTILRSIEKAKSDNQIKGIILDLTTMSAGYAKLTEVRNKLEEFKESGKFIYAFADYYYFPSYYVASVADSVFVNPQGEMAFTGMVAEIAFFSETLKKLGVEMKVVKAGKFKGAVEPYTRTSLSEANKQQIQTYINSLFNNTLEKVSASRGLSVEKMKKDADGLAIKNVAGFIKEGYIDASMYRDQLYALMKKRIGVDEDKKISLVSEQRYAKTLSDKWGSGQDKIAVVYAQGDIVGGKTDGSNIAADDMAAALKRARLNDKIKAVVFRVDSRGGSALASDIIWREAKLLAKEKPLIVSMGDVAASGGYYIATPANKIVAEPSTVTGSIGVFGLIPNASELLNEKLGLSFEYVGTGEHADVGRIDRNMKPEEREYIEGIIEKTYETFLSRVAEGRGMTRDEVHEVAQGRVWTGTMAKEVGLVDELGGLETAIGIAAKEAGLDTYRISEYPALQDPVQVALQKIQGNASIAGQMDELTKNSVMGTYLQSIKDLDRWGSSRSVQMLMPFDLKVKNYFLH